ncbi:hypothetical protein ESCNG_180025 [Neisseria gonorrhoeae]|nr:hypothetical protein ESCNG_180025 [Neisseria gonorrhoeae]
MVFPLNHRLANQSHIRRLQTEQKHLPNNGKLPFESPYLKAMQTALPLQPIMVWIEVPLKVTEWVWMQLKVENYLTL